MSTRNLFTALIVFVCSIAFTASAQVHVQTEIIPTNITLVWEADSYVPPFYKGRALIPDGGDARIIALLPPGIETGPAINYVWRVDGKVDSAASGYGKSNYHLTGSMFGGRSFVVVDVYNGQNLIGSGALRIPVSQTHVLVYADTPLSGVLFNVENPRLEGEEVAVETYPTFFSTRSRTTNNLSYTWKLNGLTITNPLGDTGRLAVRSESVGTTTVSVSVRNSSNILELATGETRFFLE